MSIRILLGEFCPFRNDLFLEIIINALEIFSINKDTQFIHEFAFSLSTSF